MTASAYEQQRDKLKPDAFKALLHEFNATMTDVETMKGLRVYAIDGSDFCTPLNSDYNDGNSVLFIWVYG